MATISDIKITRELLGSSANAEVKKIIFNFHDGKIPNICPMEFSFNLNNTTLQFANAFRREMYLVWGWTFKVISFDPSTTENMVSILFIKNELENLRVPFADSKLLESLEYKIDIQNNTPISRYVRLEEMTTSTNLKGIELFDPKVIISMVRPGDILRMTIGFEYGDPKHNVKFSQVSRVVFKYNDIPLLPESETHLRDSKDAYNSGYSVPSVQANPTSFQFSGVVTVTNSESKNILYSILNYTCQSLIDKFNIIGALNKKHQKSNTETVTFQNVYLNVIQLNNGLNEATIQIYNECHSLGGLFCRYVTDIEPNISFVVYKVIVHEKKLEIIIKYDSNINQLINKVVSKSLEELEHLKTEIISLSVN
jgi:DNA-directed RNA polymerase subunit L